MPCYGTRLEDICLILNLFTYKIKIIALLWGLVFKNYCPAKILIDKNFLGACPVLNLFTYKIKVLALLKYNNIKFLKLGACPVGRHCIVCGAMVVSLSAPHRADVNRRALGCMVACCRACHSEQLSPHNSHIYLSIKPNFRTHKSFLKPQDLRFFFLTKSVQAMKVYT